MKTKKWMSAGLALALAVSMLLGGCGSSGDGGSGDGGANPSASNEDGKSSPEGASNEDGKSSLEGASIEFAYGTNSTEPVSDILESLAKQFEEETGVKVAMTKYPSDDYENVMKTRMASNELPDIFETHGWSRLRYSEYLYPVNDEPWYKDETELAKGILTGEGDTAYALMISASALGIACNKTAAAQADVDVDKIETMDDYKEACKKLIDQGIVPMVNHGSAGDFTHVAGIFTSYPDALSCDGDVQLNGTWDWESFRAELDYFSELIDMGAYWEDRSTMGSTEDNERLANGKSVFYFANSAAYISSVAALNPDNEYAIIPFPAIKEGAKRYVGGGESIAFGIYKDTKQLEACRAFLQFLADHSGELVEAAGGIPALTTAKVEETPQTKVVTTLLKDYPDAVYLNMWDREYMPSGMWGVFKEAVEKFYNDNSAENQEEILKFLKENYNEKYEAAHSN